MAANKSGIVVVTTDTGLLRRVQVIVRNMEVDVYWEKDIDSLLDLFQEETFELVIVPGKLFLAEDTDGPRIIRILSRKNSLTRILLLLGKNEDRDQFTQREDARFHFGLIDSSEEELKESIQDALSASIASKKKQQPGEKKSKCGFKGILGESPEMKWLFKQIRRSSSVDIPVLLQGATGTGKDLVAKAIHNSSSRAHGPFIPIHLGALPAELVGSELFGHVKGAFTGAAAGRKGKFEMGQGGTVFLDEIATLDESVQIHLLRLLETRSFYRLGGKRVIKVDVRVIAASNENLSELVERGKFREDLFYRLDVFPIELPPLRERNGDLELLASEFCGRFAKLFDKKIDRIDPSCFALIRNHDWPGNVRELKNVIQRAVLVCNESVLMPHHLPPRFQPNKSISEEIAADSRSYKARGTNDIVVQVGSSLDEMERITIAKTLEYNGGNRKRTAEILGISRRSLYNKLEKYNLK